MAEQALIFFHIHKTGGQTLAGVIHRQYPRGAVRDIWLQRPETIDEFLALPEGERAKLRALTGHMPFGFHRYLPQGARYVTLLRDPVKRFLSEYRHLCDLPEEWGVWRPPEACLESVDSYLDYVVSNNMCNVQTGMVGGFVKPEDRPPLAPLPADALETAKHNLENDFAVVGATERFDESLVLMQQIFGWTKSIHYMRRNVRETHTLRRPVTEATLERIREGLAWDVELVAHGARLLDDRIRQAGDTLEAPLRKLRRVNAHLERLLTFAHLPAVRRIRAVPGLRQIYDMTGILVRKVT
jgi:hypothetical protein